MKTRRKRSSAAPSTPPDQHADDSTVILVRRGALRRFDKLKRKTAELPVTVAWDRRLDERRTAPSGTPQERRAGDRRQSPPFTWELADFVVVPGTPAATPAPTTPPPARAVQSATGTRPARRARSGKSAQSKK